MKVRTVVSSKTGKQSKAFSMPESEYLALTRDYQGLCVGCGETRDACEPDACRYECEVCGEQRVYGAEELMMMGRIELETAE